MDFDQSRKFFIEDLGKVKTLEDLENLRIKYLGRKSELAQFLRSLKDMSVEEKRRLGPAANHLRNEFEEVINGKLKELIVRQEAGAIIDVTMPGRKAAVGHYHPLTLIENQIKNIFADLNFSIVEGPEVETEFYNFDALNMPANHPARDTQDTFWLSNTQINADKSPRGSALMNPRGSAFLMRTQTSPMQIRYMEKHQPPFQIIVPGRVFRNEATDATHEINFHQIEGLMVGKNISLANFKFVISEFFKRFFSRPIEIQIRPSYFPFVEPGLEVAIKIERGPSTSSGQIGKPIWLEVAGAGMVHPKVFEAAGYVPGQWQGFAFGMGLERLAMIKYKIPDIRMFYQNDLRFIRQF